MALEEPAPFAFAITHEKLREYGPFPTYRTQGGTTIIDLPTRTLPLSHMVRGNWSGGQWSDDFGHFRHVYRIKTLIDGSETGIFVKSPERIFTQSKRNLVEGDFWWGGQRSGEKRVFIPGSSIVEEQSIWEAIFLMEVIRAGLRAERPQALLIHPNGEHRVVVEGIQEAARWHSIPYQGPEMEEVIAVVKGLGITPNDLTSNNILKDKGGYLWIIDTNRWFWSPYTDRFRGALLELVKKQGAAA